MKFHAYVEFVQLRPHTILINIGLGYVTCIILHTMAIYQYIYILCLECSILIPALPPGYMNMSTMTKRDKLQEQ